MINLNIHSNTLIFIFLCMSGSLNAKEYFNSALLDTTSISPHQVDLSSFEAGNQAVGKYRVDVFINTILVTSEEIEFIHTSENTNKQLIPCFSIQQLHSWGVKIESYYSKEAMQEKCLQLTVIPNATSTFKFNTQQLELSIPQTALISYPRDYIHPDKWDEGINAFLFNYSLNGYSSLPRISELQQNHSQYGNFRPGLNIGPWRLRNYSTWNHESNKKSQWDSVYNYLERNIKKLSSTLTIGETNSSGDIFDSLSFRGIQLASDDDMLPDSQRGYAPVVRGIARTNAQVFVKQNGHIIYKSAVAPGAFEITDLYPTGGSGDMELLIQESDGSVQHQSIPYSSLAILQREGQIKYSVTSGKTDFDNEDNASFGQFSIIYGLPFGITGYAGVQTTDTHYSAISSGIGLNLGNFGAISTDITQSNAVITVKNDKKKNSGQSLRLRYSKDILTTGTNMTLAGYRYSTKGYYTLNDALATTSEDESGHKKNRLELSLSQDIIYGSLSISMVKEHYWDNEKSSSLSVGYNNNWNSINYGLNFTSENSDDSNDRLLAFNISIPIDSLSQETSLNYNMNSNKDGTTVYNVGASGSFYEDRSLTWNIQQGYNDDTRQNNGNINFDYKSRYAELVGGYGYDTSARNFNYGIQGGLLVHNDGVTFSQPFNDTVILVHTYGAESVPVSNQINIRTDSHGFAVIPYANPYHNNTVSLDTEGIDNNNIDLLETSKTVIPSRGSVVIAKYRTSVGFRALFYLSSSTGKPVPFGTTVTYITEDQNLTNSGIVGDDGQVYLSGLENTGVLYAKWGVTDKEQCHVNFSLAQNKNPSGIEIIHAKCL